MKIKELKNGWEFNGQIIPNDENNTDYQLIKKYIAEGGEYEKFDWLQDAKDLKIKMLKDYIIKKKTEPFQKLRAPEVVFSDKGLPIQKDYVLFRFYNDTLPNSAIKSTDLVNSVALDYLELINNILLKLLTLQLDPTLINPINSDDIFQNILLDENMNQQEKLIKIGQTISQLTIKSVGRLLKNSIEQIYKGELSKGISLYPCDIVRDTKNEEGEVIQTIERGVVNIFPIVFSLKRHLSSREKLENGMLSFFMEKINNCQSVEDVEAINFES